MDEETLRKLLTDFKSELQNDIKTQATSLLTFMKYHQQPAKIRNT